MNQWNFTNIITELAKEPWRAKNRRFVGAVAVGDDVIFLPIAFSPNFVWGDEITGQIAYVAGDYVHYKGKYLRTDQSDIFAWLEVGIATMEDYAGFFPANIKNLYGHQKYSAMMWDTDTNTLHLNVRYDTMGHGRIHYVTKVDIGQWVDHETVRMIDPFLVTDAHKVCLLPPLPTSTNWKFA